MKILAKVDFRLPVPLDQGWTGQFNNGYPDLLWLELRDEHDTERVAEVLGPPPPEGSSPL